MNPNILHRNVAFFTVLFLIFSATAHSQPWMSGGNADSMEHRSFYDIQRSFRLWESSQPQSADEPRDEEEERPSWMIFKRWEKFMAPRVYPSGDISLPSRTYEIYQDYLYKSHTAIRSARSAFDSRSNWASISPPTAATNGGGNGRVNFVRVDPTNSNKLWAATASGGLWKSVNGGGHWSVVNDWLSVLGTTDVIINPLNTNVMYLSTGDGDHRDTYTIGVLRSNDGGVTWDTTGFRVPVSNRMRIHRLVMNPNDTAMLIAATSTGVFRTTNSGRTWAKVWNGNFTDVAFKPGSPSTVYAVSKLLHISTNSGATFNAATSIGLPSGINRLAIGVSAANPSWVYILACDSVDFNYTGLYRSTNSGTSFTQQSSSPNLLGYDASGTDNGGQGWYTLSIAVSPTDASDVYVAGVNHWHSADAGVTWSCLSHWYGCCGLPYVHADVHSLNFDPANSSTLYSANDGGVFKTTDGGMSWTDIGNDLQIAQIYRLSSAATSPSLIIAGHQDNGTTLTSNAAWDRVLTGDGMECHIDPVDSEVMYAEIYYGAIYKSSFGFFSQITSSNGSGYNEQGDWVTPYIIDPTDHNRLLMGKHQVYSSPDGGQTWSQIGTNPDTAVVIALAMSASSPNRVYAATPARFFAINNGSSTIDRTAGLPVDSCEITYIAVSNTDPNHVWVTFSGYKDGLKIFRSIDGGATWVNVSANLPNLPANCVVYQNNTNNGVYVGMDVGVYFISDSFASWQPYNTHLPNVVISELEIQYATGKLRAATFGRALWESDLAIPSGSFTVNKQVACIGDTLSFSVLPSDTPSSAVWSFGGGAPAVSASYTQAVSYDTVGTYPVSLQMANANGNVSVTRSSYINVVYKPSVSLSFNKDTLCSHASHTLLVGAPAGGSYSGSGVVGSFFTPSPALVGTDTIVYHYTDANGCSNSAKNTITVVICAGLPDVSKSDRLSVYPNPSDHILNIESDMIDQDKVSLMVYDMAGKMQRTEYMREGNTIYLSTESLAAGIYTFRINAGGKEYTRSFVRK